MRRAILLVVASLLILAAAIVAPRRKSAVGAGGGAVRPEDLAGLIDGADKLVVLRSPREGSPILYESSDRRDLDALKAALRVERPDEHLHCMCDGSPAITLYIKGEQVGQITNHHGLVVRCNLWDSDAPIADAQAFLKWFDARNIPGPRREYEENLEREKEWLANERKWLDAMPSALKPHWAGAVRGEIVAGGGLPRDADLTPLRKALEEQFPAKDQAILALFSWYGSGTGRWSAYPSYESVAGEMLLDYSTANLLAAVEGKELTEAQTEGVARLFGGWTFSQRRPNDDRLLPAELKARLLKHSLRSTDEDKRRRAQNAFGAQ
jgi:hypothetical protein